MAGTCTHHRLATVRVCNYLFADRLRMVWNGAETPPGPITVPDLCEVWNWEGDASVLPFKWEALIQSAFSSGMLAS
jgi:hypothetical protein